MKVISIRVPPYVKQKLENVSKSKGISQSMLIRSAIGRFIYELEKGKENEKK